MWMPVYLHALCKERPGLYLEINGLLISMLKNTPSPEWFGTVFQCATVRMVGVGYKHRKIYKARALMRTIMGEMPICE